ncbi:hypothetical protein ACO0KW_16905 [Undibacterium sp. Ji22W]
MLVKLDHQFWHSRLASPQDVGRPKIVTSVDHISETPNESTQAAEIKQHDDYAKKIVKESEL